MKRILRILIWKAFLSLLSGLFLLGFFHEGEAQPLMSEEELSNLIASCDQTEKSWVDTLIQNNYRSQGLGKAYQTEGVHDCGRLFPAVIELQRRQAALQGEINVQAQVVEKLKAKQVVLEGALAEAGESAANDSKRALETINRLRQRVAKLTSEGQESSDQADGTAVADKNQLSRIEEQNQKLKSEVAALRKDRSELLASISANNEEVAAGSEELSQLKNQLLSLRASFSDQEAKLEEANQELAKTKIAENQARTKADELENLLRQQKEKNPDQELMLELEAVRRAKLSLELELKAAGAEVAHLTIVENQARGALEAASSHNMQLRAQIDSLQKQLALQKEETAQKKEINLGTPSLAQVDLSSLHAKLMKRLDDVSSDVALVNGRAVLGNRVLFEKGSAELSDDGKAVLAVLAKAIKQTTKGEKGWVLQVDGHTDSDPISNEQYPSNWYLASGRAIAVVESLVANGIKSRNLSAVSFAEFQPKDERDTSKAKAINRRIELRLSNYMNK